MAPIKVSGWNASEVLNIDFDQIHCNGHAPSQGRRCRKQVASSRLSDAQNYLQILSTRSPLDVTQKDLEHAARYVICTLHRDSQYYSKAQEWRNDLDFYIKMGYPRHAQHDPNMQALAVALTNAQAAAKTSIVLQDELRVMKGRLEVEVSQRQAVHQDLEKEKRKAEALLQKRESDRKILNKHIADSQQLERKVSDLGSRLEKSEVARLNQGMDFAQSMLRNTQKEDEIKALKEELHQKDETLHKAEARADDASQKEKEIQALRKELNQRDQALHKVELRADNAKTQVKQQQAKAEEEKSQLTEAHAVDKRRLLVRLVRSQFSVMDKHRRVNALQVDNEVLLADRTKLQVLVADMTTQIEDIDKNFISPLKLNKMKKGVCGVVSVSPPTLRMKKVSTQSLRSNFTLKSKS